MGAKVRVPEIAKIAPNELRVTANETAHRTGDVFGRRPRSHVAHRADHVAHHRAAPIADVARGRSDCGGDPVGSRQRITSREIFIIKIFIIKEGFDEH